MCESLGIMKELRGSYLCALYSTRKASSLQNLGVRVSRLRSALHHNLIIMSETYHSDSLEPSFNDRRLDEHCLCFLRLSDVSGGRMGWGLDPAKHHRMFAKCGLSSGQARLGCGMNTLKRLRTLVNSGYDGYLYLHLCLPSG